MNNQPNAIRNRIYNIFRETRENIQGRQQKPQMQCNRCGGVMQLQGTTPDGRMGIFICSRCRNRLTVRL